MSRTEQLKLATLAELAVAGASVVLYAPSDDLIRALAELVIDGKIYDTTDEQGRLVLVITRAGLKEVDQ
jgi:predicted ATPase